jgi:hypothetical protein
MYGKNNQISIVGFEERKMMVGPTKKKPLIITFIVHAYLEIIKSLQDFVWNILFTTLHWLMF